MTFQPRKAWSVPAPVPVPGLVALALLAGCAAPPAEAPVAPGTDGATSALPVRYLADRFFVAPVTAGGDTVLFYTDTGGGTSMISSEAVARLGLEIEEVGRGQDSATVVEIPAWAPGAAIPAPSADPPLGARLTVVDPPGNGSPFDGFLGRTWFAGRIWEFDYPGRTLALVTGPVAATGTQEHTVRLGFQTDSTGIRTTHFPRIRVQVDGDSLDLLLDTGARVDLTGSALASLGGGPATRGTSFIAESVFAGWRERHPDWRVIEHADRALDVPMIEVPVVSVAGLSVGPVWFTMRPDHAFHEYMSQWMDRRVDGALGGSALRYLRMRLDYPAATATFRLPPGD